MKKEFAERVMREGCVDTRTYRYKLVLINGATEQYAEIQRLPLSKLDTTAALTDWETVEVIR